MVLRPVGDTVTKGESLPPYLLVLCVASNNKTFRGAQAAQSANLSDGAVVGSAVVDIIASGLANPTSPDFAENRAAIVRKVAAFVGELSSAIRA